MYSTDTISAIATPPGSGGIGIVRISGSGSVDVLKKIWEGKADAASFESHKMYLGYVQNPKGKNVIDNVLAVLMRGPHSYTGEDVVEISCHGGQIILNNILNACIDAGARLAEPGEFTRRAFMNGRMDLAQAEAVSDLIAATSESASMAALNQLEGRLSNRINDIGGKIKEIRVFVEASIDFPEEDIDFINKEGIAGKLSRIKNEMQSLIDTYSEGRVIKEGINVVVTGKPNVGKSSLFNRLVGHDCAIVHHNPGTTRDLVRESIQFSGMTFHVADSAGLRDVADEIEMMGINKAKGMIGRAALILFVLDGSLKLDADDLSIFNSIRSRNVIPCINKSDLPVVFGRKELCKFLGCDFLPVLVSAKEGKGIDELNRRIFRTAAGFAGAGKSGREAVIVTSSRHKSMLDIAFQKIGDAINSCERRESAEFMASHLQQAHDALGRITGAVSAEDILNEIFSKFCIGK